MEGFCPLASGSKGNCHYLGIGKTKILIDAGLSAKVTQQRLEELQVDLSEIQAILVSHEHTDHIAGLKTLAFKWNIPVLANNETAKGIYAALQECPQFKIFTTGEPFSFGDLLIHPFSVPHDTPDPVGFTIETQGLKIGICTDLGYVTTPIRHHLKNCDYLLMEANHEPSMVYASSRPPIYKQRVLGRNGHLSNEACAELLEQVSHASLKHIYLAHLSQECNAPQTALERVKAKIDSNIPLEIAPQTKRASAISF